MSPNSSKNAIRRHSCLQRIANGWVRLQFEKADRMARIHCVTIKLSFRGGAAVPVIIPDETLKQAGLSEREALIEISCRLFDAGKLHLNQAARLAGMTRNEFESELMSREIDVYRIDEEYLRHELEMSGGTLQR
jgi:predicted HTH domain antitoxin